MPILKIHDSVAFYRHLATSSAICALSGRGGDVAATEFANRRILQSLDLVPDDFLLDIGCGDGCLLRMAEGLVCDRVGIVPTDEELQQVQAAVPGVTLLTGVVQHLPLPSDSFSKIVCNSVLLLLESESVVQDALQEIARVARKDALIFLGEIPYAEEPASLGRYHGNSLSRFLWHQFKRRGTGDLLRSIRSTASAIAGRQTLILSSAGSFYSLPDHFIAMAQQCGLRPVTHFKYQRLDSSGIVIESPFRYNYIFLK